MPRRKLRRKCIIAENLLHAGLRIVEIAANRKNMCVVALLRDHLALLHLADAIAGIEYDDLCARHIRKSLQRSLAGIAGGRRQNADFGGFSLLFARSRHQIWQNRKRHVLEGCRLAVIQLKKMRPAGFFHLHDVPRRKLFVIGARNASPHFFFCKIIKEGSDDRLRDLAIADRTLFHLISHVLQCKRQSRDLCRNIKPLVLRNALNDRLRTRLFVQTAPCAFI